MSKSQLRLEAVRLRKQGMSVREIAKNVDVAKSTASLWVRNVVMTPQQLELLAKRSIQSWERGRTLGSLSQKNKRLTLIKTEEKAGELEFNSLTNRELQIAGLCLYWAEGTKKTRKVNFCNSDLKMIKFFISWVNKVYGIPISELTCWVGINEAHKNRDDEVRAFWSRETGIPLSNFTRTSFKKYPLKKIFENFNEHYGTLAVQVQRPTRILYKILGQIHGLSMPG